MDAEQVELNNENFNVKELNKIIKDKMIKNICKFQYKIDNKETQGTGFLCKINLINNIPMPVLITCEHVLNKDFFLNFDRLKFFHFLKGEEKIENLELNKEKRIIFRNKKFDIVIIEIKEKDNLDIFDFLNIDNSVNIHNPQIKNQKVFILHYPENVKDVYIAQGNIFDINIDFDGFDNDDEYQYNSFISNYSSYDGSSGAPIINYENKYIVGLHSGGNHDDGNKGKAILIKKAINEFNDYIYKYNNLNYQSPYSYLDTIDIIYSLPCSDKIKLFGTEFVARYKNVCTIIYNGVESDLTEYYFPITYDDIQKEDFRIKLKGVSKVTDTSYMFRFVNNLLDVPNISRMDAKNIISMEVMFEGCKKLEELKGINRWNVRNVVSMEGMFYDCHKLKYLPEIEEWNPINLKSCYQMFYGCKSLSNSEASKIEKWKNVNPNIIKGAFKGYIYGQKINKYLYGLNNMRESIDYWAKKAIHLLSKNN